MKINKNQIELQNDEKNHPKMQQKMQKYKFFVYQKLKWFHDRAKIEILLWNLPLKQFYEIKNFKQENFWIKFLFFSVFFTNEYLI